MVLVHDDDLKCIKNAKPPLETLQSDALMGFLRDYAPTIHQFQCGEYFAQLWFQWALSHRIYARILSRKRE